MSKIKFCQHPGKKVWRIGANISLIEGSERNNRRDVKNFVNEKLNQSKNINQNENLKR